MGVSILLDTLKDAYKVVGLKQSRRALKDGRILRAFVAKDADERVVRPFAEACAEAGVEVVEAESMAVLGEACGVEVGAAVAAVLR